MAWPSGPDRPRMGRTRRVTGPFAGRRRTSGAVPVGEFHECEGVTAVKGTEDRREKSEEGRAEQAQEHPGPDPVHPEASKRVEGKSPEELRRRQERKTTRSGDDDAE